MTGLSAFLAKEFAEIGSTWRIWVLPVILVFFGVSSPILARLMPALMESLTGPGTGIEIKMPSTTALDAYAQFLKNLGQMTSMAIIITAAGMISGERGAGTAVLVLTKPVSRRAFVLAKALSNATLLVVSTLVGTLVCAATTAAVFPAGRPIAFLYGVGLWLAFGLVLVTAMLLVSSWIDSQAGACAVGLAFFFLASIASIWERARHFSFAGLQASAAEAIAGKSVDVAWQLGSAGIACLVFTALAVRVFERREL